MNKINKVIALGTGFALAIVFLIGVANPADASSYNSWYGSGSNNYWSNSYSSYNYYQPAPVDNYDIGYEDGYYDGYYGTDSYNGYDDTYDEGYLDGYDDGYADYLADYEEDYGYEDYWYPEPTYVDYYNYNSYYDLIYDYGYYYDSPNWNRP